MTDTAQRKGAFIDGPYRYNLWRTWDFIKGQVVWVMLNPSTADANADDPTIRRCINFARDWGYGGIVVVNLFGLRATDPKKIKNHADPVGPKNDEMLLRQCQLGEVVICAWGNHGLYLGRDKIITELLNSRGVDTYRLGAPTKEDSPRHPLYMRKDIEREVHP